VSVLVGGIPGNSSRLGGGLAGTGPEMMSDVTPCALQVSPKSLGPNVGKFRRAIVGITKDSAGAALGACTVHAFRTPDDVEVDQQPSDVSGNYEVSVYDDGPFYLKAEKAGAPNVAGATDNTLVGV